MPDILDGDGLRVKTLTELTTELTDKLKAIYGADINVEANSPDGQQINIYCQTGIDLREVLQKVYNSFNPDLAEGKVLDQRVAINNIKRKKGSFTIQDIQITVDRALNLVGLDTHIAELNPDIENLYTVKDDEGNEFYLSTSQSILSAGTYTFEFRAKVLGEIQTLPNTITTPVTIIAGVTGINNPSAIKILGVNEETDIQLRIRRKSSTALSAIGPLDSLESVLNNLDFVTDVKVHENYRHTTDVNGIPPNSIWVIIENGDDDEIGEVIFFKRTLGCGMRGVETVNVLRPNGSLFEAHFDRPIYQDLWIRFSVLLPGGFIDMEDLKALIVANVKWQMGKDARASIITAYVQGLNENYVIENMEVSSDGINYDEVVPVTSLQHKFLNNITRITIL